MAEILEFKRPVHQGNGAREAVIAWLNGPPATPVPEHAGGRQDFSETTADALLAFLWIEGFKIVPLDPQDLN